MSDQTLDLLLRACGADTPLELSVIGPDSPDSARWVLRQPFALLGSDAEADVPLPDREVSQRHAYLQVVGGRVFCLDLGSRTGTRWPGGARGWGWIGPGEAVTVGPYQVEVVGGAETDGQGQANPLSGERTPDEGLPRAWVEFLNGVCDQGPWPMNRRVALVGRAPNCKVRLNCPSVSRVHCALLRTPLGVWVVDLKGREGVSVNGQRVRFARLDEDDEFRVGQFRLAVRYEEGARDAPLSVHLAHDETHVGFAHGHEAGMAVPGAVLTRHAQPARPTGLAPGEGPGGMMRWAESFLMPLVGQFSMLQQQMFEQFQEAMRMAHRFSALHRDQIDLVHRELQRLSQLSTELYGLQRELAATRDTRAEVPAGPATAKREDFSGVATESPQPLQAADAPLLFTPAPLQQRPETRPDPLPAERRPAAAASATGTHGDSSGSHPLAPEGRRAGDEPKDDVHLWLNQRIEALQQEQQSCWQRIRSFLLRGVSQEAVP